MAVVRCWMAKRCMSRLWSISVRAINNILPALPTFVLCIVALATSGLASADELKPFEASYAWVWHGMNVAVSSLKLEQHQYTWVYSSKSDPRGIGKVFAERPTQQS